jgi:uncharacterized protein (DUF1697 family)
MPRYAAFLRGINLGRRRVTGEQLCAPLRGLGFAGVASFLASGNLVFDSPEEQRHDELEARVGAALEAALGYEVLTFVRGAAEVAAIVARTPFPPAVLEGSAGKLQVILLQAAPDDAAAAAVLARAPADDRLVLVGTELYWLPAGNVSASALDLDALGRLLGPTTVRTANTLARLHRRFFDTV